MMRLYTITTCSPTRYVVHGISVAYTGEHYPDAAPLGEATTLTAARALLPPDVEQITPHEEDDSRQEAWID
jgi:hypothetical protein